MSQNSKAGKKRSKIEMLSVNLQDDINERLLSGEPIEKVSKWLKEEKQLNVGTHALKDHLGRIAGPMTALHGSYYRKMTLGLPKKLDALTELYRAAQVQMKRLSVGLQAEQTKTAMLSVVDKGLDLLRRICLDILTAEMDLGVRKRVSSGEAPQGLSDSQLLDLLKNVMSLEKKTKDEPAADPSK